MEDRGSNPRWRVLFFFFFSLDFFFLTSHERLELDQILLDGDVAQMVEHSLSMRGARGSIPRISTLFSFFPDFFPGLTTNSNTLWWRGCSSDGRALALHARGRGIDTPHFHCIVCFFLSYPEREALLSTHHHQGESVKWKNGRNRRESGEAVALTSYWSRHLMSQRVLWGSQSNQECLD